MVEITGGERLKAKLDEIASGLRQGGTLKVGFLQGATYPDGTSVPMVAAVQEFGAPSKGIPSRPFFRNMVAKESGGWPVLLARQLKNGYDVKVALGRVGAVVAGQLRQSIVDTNEPENSPVTNLLKQRFPMGGHTFADVLAARKDVKAGATAPAGKPLVWTGQMLNSIDFQVDDTRFEGPRGAVPWGADK